MSNFFEQELRKLFGDGEIIQSPQFVGRACLGTLDGDLRVRAEFVTIRVMDQYEALRLTVLKRSEGEIDTITIRIGDMIGYKKAPNLSDGTSPHIWCYQGKTKWFAYQPTAEDYEIMRQSAAQYLGVFRERTPERTQPRKQAARKSRGAR